MFLGKFINSKKEISQQKTKQILSGFGLNETHTHTYTKGCKGDCQLGCSYLQVTDT